MPLYEYKCPKCGIFESMQSLHDDPLSVCPICNDKVEKLISAPGCVIFKGDGFYETDYKRKKQKKEE